MRGGGEEFMRGEGEELMRGGGGSRAYRNIMYPKVETLLACL